MLAKLIQDGILSAIEKYSTRVEVARRTGVSVAAVSQYANRKKKTGDMTVATFEKLLRVLDNVSVTDLSDGQTVVPMELTALNKAWATLPQDAQKTLRVTIAAVLGVYTGDDEV